MQPLDSVNVVDTTQMLSGPLASMYLGDLGAEVVKVERPDGGNFTRQYPTFVDGFSGYFGSLNRNKHSVTIDLSSDEGHEIFFELLEDADVLLENYKLDTVDRLDLGYDTVRQHNPEIVYCSIKAFGKDSPYRGRPAFDILMQAMGGAMDMTGEADGPPLRTNVPIGDIAASMFATQAILAALFSREVNDTGSEFIEISMLNSLLSWLGPRATNSILEDEPYPRRGNNHQLFVPYGVFDTADSHICVAIASENFWEGFCDAIERPDLADDPRFASMADRRKNRDELQALLDDIFAQRETTHWFEALTDHGVPAGPVYDTLELWEDPHIREQSMLERYSIGDVEDGLPVPRYPVNFSSFTAASAAPPALGSSTRTYLERLGYSETEISELAERDII